MAESNVLVLTFRVNDASDTKKYQVKIPDPAEKLTQDQIQAATKEMSASRAFDFGGLNDYHLVKAHYVNTQKESKYQVKKN